MKIGLFTDSDVFAGTERHMMDLGLALREHGCEVTMLCPAAGVLAGKARKASLQVRPLEKGSPLNLSIVAQLAAELRHGSFDVLHTHNGRSTLHAVLAGAFSWRSRIVATQHFITPARARRKAVKALITNQAHRWVGRRIQHVIAISEAVRSASLGRGEIEKRKITVIPNGITDPAQSPGRTRMSVRTELKISPGAPVLATVARLEEEKGHLTLLAAMELAIRQRPDLHCLILGEGSMRARLEKEITRCGLHHAVHLLGFQNDVFSFVNAADFFVLPSPKEPFGLAIVEAMGLSRAVIAARSGGPAEIITHGESGILCTPSDAGDFSRAIVELACNPGLSAHLGERGRTTFLSRFTAARMASDTLRIYQSILGHSQSPVCQTKPDIKPSQWIVA